MRHASIWIGGTVAALGAAVVAGWLVSPARLEDAFFGAPAPRANCAAGLILLGLALALRAPEARIGRALSHVLSGAVALLALLTLVEHATGWAHGLDELIARDPTTPDELHPGRMAVASAAGLLAASIALPLIDLAARRARLVGVARAFCETVLTIGVLALLGHAVGINFLYTWYVTGAMPVSTAAALAVLGVGLLAAWRAAAARPISEERRITRAAAIVLILVAGSTAVASIAALESQIERSLVGELRNVLTAQLELLTTTLDLRQTRAEIATTRPNMLRHLRMLAQDPARAPESHAVVQGVLESFLAHDFSQIMVRGPNGREIARAGTALPPPTLEVPLARDGAVRLVWRGGLALHQELPLSDPQGLLGTLAAEQRLQSVTQLLQGNQTTFPSGELLLCRPVGLQFQCLPSRLSAGAVVVPPSGQGQRRLTERALLEGAGVATALDYRGHRVLGAYEHIPSYGLVAILKVDLDDIYAPIRRQVGAALLVAGAVILGGVGLARARVRPLATRLETLVAERTAELLETTARLEREVAERGRAEASLRASEAELRDRQRQTEASEARFRALVEGSIQGIYVTGGDLRIRYANAAVARIYGFDSPDELIGRRTLDFYPPDEQARVAGYAAARSRGEPAPTRYEVQAFRRDGSPIWLELLVSVVGEPGERVYQTTLIDISERRAAEQALKQRDEQLRQAQKLESIGQLAGGVAHDLNNLLAVVIGRGQLLLSRLPADDRDAKGVAMIVSSAERGAAVVRQLLTFSRRQPVELRALDVNRIVVDLVPMLRRFIGEQIELVVRPGADLGWARADKSQIEQIAMNLVINARDAMPDGGTVVIETANVEISEDYARQHLDASPGPHVMLAVTDTGIGMDAATQARIFEPFFTTKELGKGTGLGLATVYGIVKQSQGSIWVYSEVGRGTTFKIYLPRVAPHADDDRGPASRPRQGTETILVAEDEAEVRDLVRDILESYGYTVLVGRDPAEALLIAERHTGPIHLLLTDVIMPGATGHDLALSLAPLRPETRTLYMSGYPGEAIVRQGRLEPGTEYLQKPFMPEALAAKVRAVLDAAD